MADRRGSVDPDDVARFDRLGAEWWNPRGPMRALHKFNPVRVAWLRERMRALAPPGGDPARPLADVNVLDIGCGGGILCEPLARLGASVTGVDPAPGNIDIARRHAETMRLAIDYRATTAEELAAAGSKFDAVCAMEVIEHVADMPGFMAAACSLARPGGLVFAATLNRTLKSFALAIVGAEYVLRWVPKGTHQWEKFVTPDELEDALAEGGVEVTDRAGVVYSPLLDKWRVARDMDVNYMLVGERRD